MKQTKQKNIYLTSLVVQFVCVCCNNTIDIYILYKLLINNNNFFFFYFFFFLIYKRVCLSVSCLLFVACFSFLQDYATNKLEQQQQQQTTRREYLLIHTECLYECICLFDLTLNKLTNQRLHERACSTSKKNKKKKKKNEQETSWCFYISIYIYIYVVRSSVVNNKQNKTKKTFD